MTERHAVLVMAYGTPRDLDDVEAYYTHIRHGRPPSPEALQELKDRYATIGGRSPLLEITRAQADGLSERLGLPAYLGQKHSAPFISDAIASLSDDGIGVAVGVVLAPHYSAMSIGDYTRRARLAAQETGWTGRLEVVRSWHLEPGYIGYLRREVAAAIERLPGELRADALVLFTAHSLPERILQRGDPYPDQLRATAAAVMEGLGDVRWQTGWQSAGRTGDRWLGPDLLEIIEKASADDVRAIVVCPCGFVADHLEVLYDVDIEARGAAERFGIALERTSSPNDDPDVLDAVAGVVRKTLAGLG